MFVRDIRDFSENLDALRDFVELIEPILSSQAKDTIMGQKENLLLLVYALRQAFPDGFPEIAIPEQVKKSLKKKVKVKMKDSLDKESREIKIRIKPEGDLNLYKLLADIKEISQSQIRSRLLFNSSLISLVSAVEWFFSRLLHGYFQKYPQVAISGDRVFSYEDLTHFTSIDDARQYIIEKRVEEVLRGSFSDWIKYFRNAPQLSMSYIEPCMEQLIEVCERRNLLVHNNGIVNKIYLSKVSESLAKSLKPGQPLVVTRDYLDNNITLFERCCILIAAELWKKLSPSDTERGSLLIDIAFNHMKKNRWLIVENLSCFVMNDKKLPDRDLMVGKMNYWLSVKRLGRWSEIKSQVEREDITTRGRLFQLAWYSLCEKPKEFFALLPRAVKGEDVDLSQLESFPIFDEMRDSRKFLHTVSALKKNFSKRKRSTKRKAKSAKIG
jgi:hypothetical protein